MLSTYHSPVCCTVSGRRWVIVGSAGVVSSKERIQSQLSEHTASEMMAQKRQIDGSRKTFQGRGYGTVGSAVVVALSQDVERGACGDIRCAKSECLGRWNSDCSAYTVICTKLRGHIEGFGASPPSGNSKHKSMYKNTSKENTSSGEWNLTTGDRDRPE